MSKTKDTFQSHEWLEVNKTKYRIAKLEALEKRGFPVARLPFAHKILLENLLRREDGVTVTASQIEALARWDAKAVPSQEIEFAPARVILQDFTGVPAVVDLAAMRDAMQRLGGDPKKINPIQPVQLVIDHSVQVDAFGKADAFQTNVGLEYRRNVERYQFLRWGQKAFDNFKVVPPGTGIVHQVNIEYLASVVAHGDVAGQLYAYPDTLVGTDSHTTMVNGLGVLGWGVGGIEAEAAMLGQPVSMLVPEVIGMRFTGRLAEGATATDLVLTVTEILRKKGVVNKFVEFYGPGVAALSLADRATVANMAPEYGATCGLFPVDVETLNYLRFTGRSAETVALVEAYAKAQGLFWTAASPEATYTDTLSLDLGSVEPCLAGPKRPQDRVPLFGVPKNFEKELPVLKDAALKVKPRAVEADVSLSKTPTGVATSIEKDSFEVQDGSVVIAAITSCTNTSNPSVLVAAGLLAEKARAKGLTSKPWVKTSLAPGSQVVTDYLTAAGVMKPLEELKFHLVGYGCTTCIGNSGPLPKAVSAAIDHGQLVAVSVLSGNRNFEGRVNPDVRANYLASPPLVVAYALAGRIGIDWQKEPVGQDQSGAPVFLKDIWPSSKEVQERMGEAVRSEMFVSRYSDVFKGDAQWQSFVVPDSSTYSWDDDSTYIKNPPYFDGMTLATPVLTELSGARALAILGDSVTTDHISPAGNIKADSPAGKYLQQHGVAPADFNQYGARRGNHEVMMRGTFANTRIKNAMLPGVEGGVTAHQPSGAQMSIFDAAMQYQKEGVPTIVLAGKEYGTGSSRDWAAKGPMLLGVRAVVAESFERIHRSNLVGMGILPCEFVNGESAASLGLTGKETFAIEGLSPAIAGGMKQRELTVRARGDGGEKSFKVRARLDTPQEIEYFRHGGILHFVIRQLARS